MMQIQLVEGASLPDSEKAVRQENINLYAKASRDFNPIHLDPEFAKKTELGGIVAHGMLVLATGESKSSSVAEKSSTRKAEPFMSPIKPTTAGSLPTGSGVTTLMNGRR